MFQCVPFQPPADREAFSFSFRVVRAVRVVRAKLCVRVSVSGPKGRVPGGGADTRAAPRVTATLSSIFRFFCFVPPCFGDPSRPKTELFSRAFRVFSCFGHPSRLFFVLFAGRIERALRVFATPLV